MEGLLIRIESPRLAVAPQFERGGPSIRGEKNQAIGISRGGRTTKIHAIVDSKGRPLSFTVTGGQVHDSQVVEEVLNTPRAPLAVTADTAYDSEKVRQQIKDEGALPIIPNRCPQESLLAQARWAFEIGRPRHGRRGRMSSYLVNGIAQFCTGCTPQVRQDLISNRDNQPKN
jgi:transposase